MWVQVFDKVTQRHGSMAVMTDKEKAALLKVDIPTSFDLILLGIVTDWTTKIPKITVLLRKSF
jgi:hypothetical protein